MQFFGSSKASFWFFSIHAISKLLREISSSKFCGVEQICQLLFQCGQCQIDSNDIRGSSYFIENQGGKTRSGYYNGRDQGDTEQSYKIVNEGVGIFDSQGEYVYVVSLHHIQIYKRFYFS